MAADEVAAGRLVNFFTMLRVLRLRSAVARLVCARTGKK
jgi:hypothetical protein